MPFWIQIALVFEKILKSVFRRQADYMVTMRFRGRVIDQRTGKPLAGVQVLFLDTGFDYRRRKEPEKYALPVGESGADGSFDVTFRYLWGAEVVWLSKSRIGNSFKLHFVRDGFVLVERQFDPWRLPYEENILQVCIPEDIALEPVGK